MFRRIKSVLLAAAIAAVSVVPSAAFAADETPAAVPEANWKVYEQKYDSTSYVVAGCTVLDFGAKGDGVTDDTEAFQAAIDYMKSVGGGGVFVPEGKYVIRSGIVIKEGTMLIGENKIPEKGESIQGTIIMPYGGRGNADAEPCITMQQMTACRNLNFWYPEQDADNIAPYPPTILMGDKTQWGDQYCDVENIVFVNSYIGFKKGAKMGGCPMVRGIYGSPLKTGVMIDSLGDVGRVESCDFSPVYWEKSGMPNSPSETGAHRDFMYTKGVAVQMHRNDWSYGRFLSAEGYYAGFYALNSFNEEAWDGENRLKDNFPNGENYGLSYKDCYIGIEIENTSNAGVVFTEVDIDNCENGFVMDRTFDSKVHLNECRISANEDAILNEGNGIFMGQNIDIEKGKTEISSGYASLINCNLNGTAPQISYGKFSGGSVIGCKFKETETIENNSSKEVIIDDSPVEMERAKKFPKMELLDKKPARAVLYNIKDFGAVLDGVTDDSPAIQKALDKAGSEGGGIVLIPSGFCAMKSGVTVPSGVELRGTLDTPQQPIKVGTTVEVYAGKGNENGAALITLKANSIVRGIAFDYPEQDYLEPVPYPYAVRGDGENVSIINIAFRMAYSMVDLASTKCDNAYVEYVSGHSWRRGIFVGGGSENVIISNTQMNYNTVNSGFESKWGSWTTGPSKGDGSEAAVAKWKEETNQVEGIMKKNYEAFWIGDAQNILFYNNFVFPGGAGLTLTSQDGKAPTGLSLGYGSDNSRVAFLLDDIGDGGFDFINTQLVGITSHGMDAIGIETTKNFNKKITLFGCAVWGGLESFTDLNGSGTVEIQCGNFASQIKRDFIVNAGKLKVFNSKINKYSERLGDSNGGSGSFIGCNYMKTNAAEAPSSLGGGEWRDNLDLSSTTYVKTKESKLREFVLDENIIVKAGTGKLVFNDASPFMQGSQIYVPFNVVLKKFGYPIEETENSLSVTSADKSLFVTLGSNIANVDGRSVEMSGAVKKVGNSICVPSDFIGKALGSDITWKYKTRTLTISVPKMADTPKDSTAETVKLNIYSVSATGEQAQNPATNATDGSRTTRWAAEGEHSLVMDLGSNRIVDSMKISFNAGESRIYPFTVEISEDGENWTQIIKAQNSGKTQEFEEYKPESFAYGRYVRYNGNGSNVNKYNNIWEIEVYGK